MVSVNPHSMTAGEKGLTVEHITFPDPWRSRAPNKIYEWGSESHELFRDIWGYPRPKPAIYLRINRKHEIGQLHILGWAKL